MQPFTKHTGLVITMDRANVDTDQIIPKQFLKRIERTGFGEFLFQDWRRADNGTDIPDFELNLPQFQGASILVARRNFGCGSSREHAVWALEDFGIRALIAPSFADIFYNNCFKNGVLPMKFDESIVDDLFARTTNQPGYQLTVDLTSRQVTDSFGLELPIDVEDFRRNCLLNGLDDIGLTLQHEDLITKFEATRASTFRA